MNMNHRPPITHTMVTLIVSVTFLAACCGLLLGPEAACASVISSSDASPRSAATSQGAGSLEAVAGKALTTGRKVAMSLIGLAFAMAAIVLAFRRDFKEAVGVFTVGLIAILLVTPAGVNLLHDTVDSLLGAR